MASLKGSNYDRTFQMGLLRRKLEVLMDKTSSVGRMVEEISSLTGWLSGAHLQNPSLDSFRAHFQELVSDPYIRVVSVMLYASNMSEFSIRQISDRGSMSDLRMAILGISETLNKPKKLQRSVIMLLWPSISLLGLAYFLEEKDIRSVSTSPILPKCLRKNFVLLLEIPLKEIEFLKDWFEHCRIAAEESVNSFPRDFVKTEKFIQAMENPCPLLNAFVERDEGLVRLADWVCRASEFLWGSLSRAMRLESLYESSRSSLMASMSSVFSGEITPSAKERALLRATAFLEIDCLQNAGLSTGEFKAACVEKGILGKRE